ncbi:MAG: hypothetical protein IK029_00360 [Oscillospiraceae bacterium]|nr:hypothetical protein [Oscillospiraceae bacterium]
METVLEIKDIVLYVPEGDGIRKVMSSYSLSLGKGEVRTVAADSGEEAHYLYRIAAGDLEPTSGTVTRSGGIIGLIRRGSEVFAELTVDENIALACGADRGEKTAAEYGLDAGIKASELSSGDRVKLLFLQRYLQEPAYIVAEEPFEGLDVSGKEQALRFITEETEKTGIPVLIIESERTGDLR